MLFLLLRLFRRLVVVLSARQGRSKSSSFPRESTVGARRRLAPTTVVLAQAGIYLAEVDARFRGKGARFIRDAIPNDATTRNLEGLSRPGD